MNHRPQHALAAMALLVSLLLSACQPAPEAVLGTLERDRISLPAPVFERIAEIPVHEGQAVKAGETLLVLESARSSARLDAARAELARLTAILAEAQAGPRVESIAEAQSRLDGAQSLLRNARSEFDRVETTVRRKLLPPAELDRVRATRDNADAQVRAARETLLALQHGTRVEQLAQAEAALRGAQANVDSLQVDLQRTRIDAPRDGTVDSLPFKVGDQLPVGTVLATLLVGERPYARVYVPQRWRNEVKVGTPAQVFLHGSEIRYAGTVRAIRSEASFTPYYALSGNDASRLSWLAEIELGSDAAELPVGMPLRAEFAAANRGGEPSP